MRGGHHHQLLRSEAKGIEAGASLDDLAQRWPRDEGTFAEERAAYLLYR